MAYNINKTDGTNLVTIADGNSDTSYSSIALFGKNYAGYGELLNENLVKMLENFSYTSAPANPLQGQLWWDNQNKVLRVRKDALWKIVSGPTSSITAPELPGVGDLWWATGDKQLKVYEGSEWKIVGPAFAASQGTSGQAVVTIPGAIDGLYHTVVEFFVGGQVAAVLSKDAAFEVAAIPGFTIIRPGFNLPTGNSEYVGNAENALSLGSVLAANYLRSDVASTTHFPLSVQTNNGLNVGLNNDLTIGVAGNASTLVNNTMSRDTEFYVNIGGVSTLALKISGATGLVTVAGQPTTSLGVANKNYVDSAISAAAPDYLNKNGSIQLVGNLLPQATGVYSLGSSSNHYATVYSNTFSGTSITATTGSFNTVTLNALPSSSSSAASKQYVDNVAAGLTGNYTALNNNTVTTIVGAAPTNLANLAAIARAINNNPNFGIDTNNAISLLAPKDSPVFTGTALSYTAPAGDVSNKIATTAFVHLAVATATANLTGSSPVFTGNTTVDTLVVHTGITTDTNDTIDIGSPSHRFRNIYGNAMSASYADLAENYVADAEYEEGTVLDFGGAHEVTLSTGEVVTRVAGVVSTDPAYLMNANCTGHFVVAVALQGRCPVKVVGSIQKGDLLVSAGNGRAKAAVTPTVGSVIGKALEDFSGTEGTVEVAIGRC